MIAMEEIGRLAAEAIKSLVRKGDESTLTESMAEVGCRCLDVLTWYGT